MSDVVQRIAELAERWAYQATDYDEDTEQQIDDGNVLLNLLRDAGVDAAPPMERKPMNPDFARLHLDGCDKCLTQWWRWCE